MKDPDIEKLVWEIDCAHSHLSDFNRACFDCVAGAVRSALERSERDTSGWKARDDDLDAIALRALQATPAPWVAQLLNDGSDATLVQGPGFASARNFDPDQYTDEGIRPDLQAQIHADASFIAKAREDVPALLDALRASRAITLSLLEELRTSRELVQALQLHGRHREAEEKSIGGIAAFDPRRHCAICSRAAAAQRRQIEADSPCSCRDDLSDPNRKRKCPRHGVAPWLRVRWPLGT